MSYIGNQPFNASFITDTFSGTGSQTIYNLTIGPGSGNAVLVVVSGILQSPSTYSVIGQILTFSQAPPTGSNNIVVRYLSLPASSITTSAYRNYTELTASAGQTTFTPASYTPGFVDVFRNGVRLNIADYTASNGTTVVLNNSTNAGDTVSVVSFYVSSVLNAIPNTAGVIGTTYLATGAVTSSTIAAGAVAQVAHDVGNLNGSGALLLPAGTTAQRPAIPLAGMLRFNSTTTNLELYGGSSWVTFGTSDAYYSSTKVLLKNGAQVDASTKRRTITQVGTVTATSGVGYPPITKSSNSITGAAGKVFQISDSTSNYLTFGAPLSDFDMSQTNWTLELWAYMALSGNAYSHWFWSGGQGGGGELKCWSGNNQPYIYSSAGQSVGASVAMASNTWTWIVVERYNGVMYMWVNGTNRASGTTMPTGGTPGTAGLGVPFNAEQNTAYVDEIRFTTVSRYQGATTIPLQTVSWPEQ